MSNIFLEYNVFFQCSNRCTATSAKIKEVTQKSEAKSSSKLENTVSINQSFVANFFRGKLESSEMFPYPYNLTAEDSETLGMAVDSFTRFFVVS